MIEDSFLTFHYTEKEIVGLTEMLREREISVIHFANVLKEDVLLITGSLDVAKPKFSTTLVLVEHRR